MRLETYLERSAAERPDKVCLVAGEQRVTYRAMDDAAGRLARGLRRRGVGRGDRVVVFLDNSVETVVAAFAAFKAGAVLSLVNPTTKSDKLAFILNNSRAAAVVTHQRLLPQAAEAIGQAPSVVATVVVAASESVGQQVRGGVAYQHVLDEHADTALPAPSAAAGPSSDDDLATIIYTSGSTGVPKGVMMTHANLDAAVESIVGYLENRGDDVLLCVLPLSFGYGLNQVLSAFRVGATVVVERGFVFAQAVIQRIQKEGVTGFALVPTMAAILVTMKDFAAGSCPHLRYITNAAAAMSPAHLARLQELFPETKIFSMYGQTECTRSLYLPPEQLATRPASVGVAIPGTQTWLVDEHGDRIDTPGQVGELVVCGRHVTQGYWELPEETARVIRPGPKPGERVLTSGDLFKQDDEGYFYFVSRKDDIIKIKGQKVSPKEVEDVLYQHPGVREAVVLGLPDPLLGSVLVAVVVPTAAGALAEADVKRHCAAHLEDVMVPARVEFRDDLPRTASGKLLRREVRTELLAAEPTIAAAAGAPS